MKGIITMIEIRTYQYAARVTTALERFIRPGLASVRQLRASLCEGASYTNALADMDEVVRGVEMAIRGFERRQRELETALQDFEISEGISREARPPAAHIPKGY